MWVKRISIHEVHAGPTSGYVKRVHETDQQVAAHIGVSEHLTLVALAVFDLAGSCTQRRRDPEADRVGPEADGMNLTLPTGQVAQATGSLGTMCNAGKRTLTPL